MLCPTRGRPHAASQALESFEETRTLRDTTFAAIVDTDDPKADMYTDMLGERALFYPPFGSMVTSLNVAAFDYVDDYDYIGFIGDDHRFRTRGWDAAFERTLADNGGGYAYANDLFWPNGEIPTQIVISTNIVRALHYFALPDCIHLYVDNAWREVGDGIDSLFYFPHHVIEHLHPAAGKAQWDEQYRRLNSEERYAADRAAFEHWKTTQAVEDIARARLALGR